MGEMLDRLRKIGTDNPHVLQHGLPKADNVDKRCKSFFLQAEIHRQNCSFEAALAACKEGLALRESVGKGVWKLGCVQYMIYIQAASHFNLGNLGDTKDALRRLEACAKDHYLYMSVLFKTTQLNRRLGVELKDAFVEVDVPAGKDLKLATQVAEGVSEVEWEWTLEDFSVNFTATFKPDDGSAVTQLESLSQYKATTGPMLGKFEPTGPGTLVLTFDNSFSWVRGKKVLCRVQPEHLLLSPLP